MERARSAISGTLAPRRSSTMLGGIERYRMPEALVTIAQYFDVTEAHIAGGLLESEGIPVHLMDVNHVSANPLLGIGLGGVRLQVPATFEQAAREVLASRKSLEEDDQGYLSADELSGRKASQDDMDTRERLGILKVFGIAVLLVIVLARLLSILG
jgi:hypothetical protein